MLYSLEATDYHSALYLIKLREDNLTKMYTV